MEENSKNYNIDWKKYDKKYKSYSLKFNKNDNVLLHDYFKKSDEKYIRTFMKKCILYGDVDYKSREELANNSINSNKEILFQLKKIGNNINQLAIKMNFSKLVTVEEKEKLSLELEKVKHLIFLMN